MLEALKVVPHARRSRDGIAGWGLERPELQELCSLINLRLNPTAATWFALAFPADDNDRVRVNAMVQDPSAEPDEPIAALLADVDGTLITREKVLTARAIGAVKRLRERGVVFCVTSGRPPRGLRMFVEPLELTIAMAAFNGGVIVRPDLSVIDEKPLPEDIPPEVIEAIRAHTDWMSGSTVRWMVRD